MTDCKSPLEIIMSHDYGFGDLREELEKRMVKAFGHPAVKMAETGASITINAGPNLVGCVILGERRK